MFPTLLLRKVLFLSMYLLLTFGLVASVARVALAQRYERIASARARAQMGDWHRQIGEELTVTQRQGYRAASSAEPDRMLQAFTVSHVGRE